MSNEMISIAREDPNRIMKQMTRDESQSPDVSSAKANPAIKFVTQNGFSIVRLSELQPSIVDSVSGCHFLVRQPDGQESQVSVAFDQRAVAQVQSQRKSRLSDTNDFWLTLAEQQLATYLWENNYPAGGHLLISQLSGDDLVLAARWSD